jgi:ketosteroid isomerase-like protein
LRTDPETEAAIFAAVDAFFDHFANCRLVETLAAFVQDEDVALYGSERAEAFVGRAAIQDFLARLFDRHEGPRFRLESRKASLRGNVAWFVAEASVTVGDQVVAPYRLSLVLERRGGRWLIALFNGSEPLPDRA